MNQNIQLPVYVFPDRAKDALMGHFTRVILIYVTYMMLNAGLSMLVSNVLNPTGYVGLVFFLLASLAASLLTEILLVGYISVFLAISSKFPFSSRNLFIGFSHNRNQMLVLAGLFTLIRTVFLLPSQLLPFFYTPTAWGVWGNLLFLWMSIFAGSALYSLITIPLSLSYYIILDFPSITARQALQKSIQKMRGQKLRYLQLLLRFLPLQLLCVCSFFIGFLWLRPYWLMTKALFYMETVKAPKSE